MLEKNGLVTSWEVYFYMSFILLRLYGARFFGVLLKCLRVVHKLSIVAVVAWPVILLLMLMLIILTCLA